MSLSHEKDQGPPSQSLLFGSDRRFSKMPPKKIARRKEEQEMVFFMQNGYNPGSTPGVGVSLFVYFDGRTIPVQVAYNL